MAAKHLPIPAAALIRHRIDDDATEKTVYEIAKRYEAEAKNYTKADAALVRALRTIRKGKNFGQRDLRSARGLKPAYQTLLHESMNYLIDQVREPQNKALVAFSQGELDTALKHISSVKNEYLRVVLKGEIYRELLQGNWKAVKGSQATLSGTVTFLHDRCQIQKGKVVEKIDFRVRGNWIILHAGSNYHCWQIRSLQGQEMTLVLEFDDIVHLRKSAK